MASGRHQEDAQLAGVLHGRKDGDHVVRAQFPARRRVVADRSQFPVAEFATAQAVSKQSLSHQHTRPPLSPWLQLSSRFSVPAGHVPNSETLGPPGWRPHFLNSSSLPLAWITLCCFEVRVRDTASPFCLNRQPVPCTSITARVHLVDAQPVRRGAGRRLAWMERLVRTAIGRAGHAAFTQRPAARKRSPAKRRMS